MKPPTGSFKILPNSTKKLNHDDNKISATLILTKLEIISMFFKLI